MTNLEILKVIDKTARSAKEKMEWYARKARCFDVEWAAKRNYVYSIECLEELSSLIKSYIEMGEVGERYIRSAYKIYIGAIGEVGHYVDHGHNDLDKLIREGHLDNKMDTWDVIKNSRRGL